MNKLSDELPSTIEEAIELPPISMILKQVNKRNIEAFLAIELTKLKSRVNIDDRLNVQASQMPFICRQLIDLFPNESLADFKICFEWGAMGRFSDGKLFRVDGAILVDWMRAYLDQKYIAIESKLMREKDNHHFEVTESSKNADTWIELWKKELGLKETRTDNKNDNAYYAYKLGLKSTSANQVLKHQLHIDWIKETHDAITGKLKEGALDERDWLLNKGYFIENGELKEV